MRTALNESGRLIDFMNDARLSHRIKIENFLLVEAGIRPCSQTTLPFDLPDASEMGAAIDRRIYPLMGQIRSIADPAWRLKAIERVKEEMRTAFKDIVESSDQYSALERWGEAFNLRILSYQVRPTVQDLYLMKDKEVESRLRRLMKQRNRLRDAVRRIKQPGIDRIRFAYPEEFLGSWLSEMGELLHAGEAQYEIRDGHLRTEIEGTPFDVTVYELGDRYVAAPSKGGRSPPLASGRTLCHLDYLEVS